MANDCLVLADMLKPKYRGRSFVLYYLPLAPAYKLCTFEQNLLDIGMIWATNTQGYTHYFTMDTMVKLKE